MTGPAPALYLGRLVHIRRTPEHRVFRHPLAMWLVDVDDLPSLPRPLGPLARWSSRDHLGSPDLSIRSNLDRWLAGQGIDLDGGRVLMLTTPRVLGYAFNPLTVYWCHTPDGVLRCVVAEVTNTYRERHCYLLPAAATTAVGGDRSTPGDGDGEGDDFDYDVEKTLRVSPFFETRGRYRMRLPPPDGHLSLTITLVDGDTSPLTAVFTAERREVSTRLVLALLLTGHLAPQRVMALIRMHGLRLWLRGLPIVSGPHCCERTPNP